jgi:hypothetical protein
MIYSSTTEFDVSTMGVLYNLSYCSSVMFKSCQIGIAVINPFSILLVRPEIGLMFWDPNLVTFDLENLLKDDIYIIWIYFIFI